jgi:hypothetical protein
MFAPLLTRTRPLRAAGSADLARGGKLRSRSENEVAHAVSREAEGGEQHTFDGENRAHAWSFARVPLHAPGRSAHKPSVKIGPANDRFERNADEIADRIECGVHSSWAHGAGPAAGLNAPQIVNDVVSSEGQPLNSASRAWFEPRFRWNFGDVRVHTGGLAEQSARAIGADAYSLGRHVVLGTHGVSPSSRQGRRLLAHELAHVVQSQNGAPAVVRRQTGGAGSSGNPPPPSMDPRHARGHGGEQTMGFGYRQDEGWIFVEGPSGAGGHGVTQGGFDGVAYNTKSDELHILDNKSLKSENVSSASALTKNLLKNLDRLIVNVRGAQNMEGRIRILGILQRARAAIAGGNRVPKNFKLVITGEGGRAKRISQRLQKQGIEVRTPGQLDEPLAPASPPAKQTSGEFETAKPGKTGAGLADEPSVVVSDQAEEATPAGAGTRAKSDSGGEAPESSGEQSTAEDVRSGAGPEFVPKAFRYGADVAEGVIFAAVADYFVGKILSHFQNKRMREYLGEMAPEIEEQKKLAIEQSPPEIRKMIEHPVYGQSRQFYWVVKIRMRTRTTMAIGGGHAVSMSGTVPILVSVTISEKSQSRTGPKKQGPTEAGTAQHAVVNLEESNTVTYSQPIISWSAEVPADIKKAMRQFGGDQSPGVDVLKFRKGNKEVTTEKLLAWARENFPGKLGGQRLDPVVAKNIMFSHEFIGSDDARGRGVMALALRLREEKMLK